LKLYDKNNQIFPNFYATLDFNILKFPSYLYYESEYSNWDDFKTNHFQFTQMSNYTDSNGGISIKIKILPNYVGIYVINFVAEAAVSDPIQFQTEYPISKISIINQTYYNFTLNDSTNKTEIRSKYLRSGNYLPDVKKIIFNYYYHDIF
jgi:hypothetical protein